MSLVKVEQIRDEVIGLCPVYTDQGNATRVYTASGSVLVDGRTLNAALKALLHSYGLELRAQHRFIRERLGRKSVLPFYLPRGRVFIPLKMRKTIVDRDNVYGYIDIKQIMDVEVAGSANCSISLVNGLQAEILSGRKTVIQSQDMGKELLGIIEKEEEKRDDDTGNIVKFSTVLGQIMDKMSRQLDRIEQGVLKEE